VSLATKSKSRNAIPQDRLLVVFFGFSLDQDCRSSSSSRTGWLFTKAEIVRVSWKERVRKTSDCEQYAFFLMYLHQCLILGRLQRPLSSIVQAQTPYRTDTNIGVDQLDGAAVDAARHHGQGDGPWHGKCCRFTRSICVLWKRLHGSF
jgi:hypothetical protein